MKITTETNTETTLKPTLSVVIIGRNEGVRLVRCIESVKAMKNFNEKVEIIYVDTASTDGSAEKAEKLGAKVIVLEPRRPTAALGRNAGWREANAAYVLFLDGDTILDPLFVERAMEEFDDPQVAVVFGHRREMFPETSIYNRVLDLDWLSPVGNALFCGGDAIMRRRILEEFDGYNENLIAGEEPEMCRRMRFAGYLISHIDEPMTKHDLAIKHFSQYWRRATRTGYAYAEVSHRFRYSGLPFWEEDVRRNITRSVAWLLIFFVGLLASLIMISPLPILAALLLLMIFSLRSAYKMSWKSSDIFTLLLYGVHSHFQHIPIFVGQLQYHRDRRRFRQRELIEYKEA